MSGIQLFAQTPAASSSHLVSLASWLDERAAELLHPAITKALLDTADGSGERLIAEDFGDPI